MRTLTYQQAINEAFQQMMEQDPTLTLIGQGLDSPWSFGDSTLGLIDKFGKNRVYDPPISENGITGIGIGASICGARTVVMHPRVDFMYLAMDQIVNHAAHWHYMFGGRVNVPIVIRGVVNRGNEQAAQHSQSPHAMFAHVPGLKVVMPATPQDAKGLMIAAIQDENPVVYIDDRWLYETKGEVKEEAAATPIGRARIAQSGKDVTIIATSYFVKEALDAAASLATEGISAEVVDLRTVKPLDKEMILSSVEKTGRLVVVDGGWRSFGVAAELISIVAEEALHFLKAKPVRVASLDAPVPACVSLEKAYFPNASFIVAAVKKTLDKAKGINATTYMDLPTENILA